MPHPVERAVPLDPQQCAALVVSERWLTKVQVEDSGCIRWVGTRYLNDYGQIKLNGRNTRAHRVAWAAANEVDVPHGLTIHHHCDNRWCVNPAHLEPVTNRGNILEGTGPTALNSVKTHCPAGHPLEGDNLQPSKAGRGKRECRACLNERNRLTAAAARGLGLTQAQYRAEYTTSRVGLEQILDSLQTPAWTPPSAAAIHAAEVWLLEGALLTDPQRRATS